MVVLSAKVRLAIRMACLFILIALCIAVYINGSKLDCSRCVVTFENTKVSGSLYFQHNFNVSIEHLYEQFMINDSCPLKYAPEGGFVYYGD